MMFFNFWRPLRNNFGPRNAGKARILTYSGSSFGQESSTNPTLWPRRHELLSGSLFRSKYYNDDTYWFIRQADWTIDSSLLPDVTPQSFNAHDAECVETVSQLCQTYPSIGSQI